MALRYIFIFLIPFIIMAYAVALMDASHISHLTTEVNNLQAQLQHLRVHR